MPVPSRCPLNLVITKMAEAFVIKACLISHFRTIDKASNGGNIYTYIYTHIYRYMYIYILYIKNMVSVNQFCLLTNTYYTIGKQSFLLLII